jgi:hypothetical protein
MESRAEILGTPALTAKSPARDLASKKSFAVLRVFKVPLLRFYSLNLQICNVEVGRIP